MSAENKPPVPAQAPVPKPGVPATAPKPGAPAPAAAAKPAVGPLPAKPGGTAPPAKPAHAPATTAKPASAAVPKPPPGDGPVLEEPQHPFEEFLAARFADLVTSVVNEGTRLKVPPITQIKVLVNMLVVRVAAFGVRASVSRADILKVLDHFWGLQPKPPGAVPPKPQPTPPGK